MSWEQLVHPDARVGSVAQCNSVSNFNSHVLVMDLPVQPDPSHSESLQSAFPAAILVPVRASSRGSRTQKQGAGENHIHWPIFSARGEGSHGLELPAGRKHVSWVGRQSPSPLVCTILRESQGWAREGTP